MMSGWPAGNQDPAKRGRGVDRVRKPRRGRWVLGALVTVVMLIAAFIILSGCSGTGRDWEQLDRKEPVVTPGVDNTRPVVEGAEPAGPNEVKFILTVWDNRGVFFNLGDAGYGASITMAAFGSDPSTIIEVNGQPYTWTVVRVLPYAFKTDVPPEVRSIVVGAAIGIPAGWKVRCDVEWHGQPYGGYTEQTAPGEAGISITEVTCSWNG
jgi:hypothetical protein